MKNYFIWFFTTFLALICLSTGYYYTIFEPKKKILPEKTQVVIDPLIELDKRLINLEISKKYWENKIKLADRDHYNIFINLSDSLVSLEMSGITAHDSKILNFKIAENIQRQRQNKDLVRMFREPFHLLDKWASIPKDPLRVKDISGYQWAPDSLNFVPDTTDTEFVFIVLKCSGNFSIMISQRAVTGKMPAYIDPDPINRFNFIMNKNINPESIPFFPLLQKNWIGIEIPRSDAIALFRGLMDKSLLVLCL
jgi:hypothetical protein